MTEINTAAGPLVFRLFPSPPGALSVGHATLQIGLPAAEWVTHITCMISADELRDLAATFITAANGCEHAALQTLEQTTTEAK